MSLRVTLSLFAAAVLVTGSIAAGAPAADSGSPSPTQSAKKKCKKGKKGAAAAKKKCKRKKKPTPPAPAPVPAPASLAISPTSHDFGGIHTPSASQVFTVTNNGGTGTGAITDSITGPGASRYSISEDTCNGMSLPPAVSCTLKVTFTPMFLTVVETATLNVSATPGGALAVPLSGYEDV